MKKYKLNQNSRDLANWSIHNISLSFLISFPMLLFHCGDKPDDSRDRLIPSVEAVRVFEGSLPLSERLTGLVRAKNRIEIYPEISAVIVEVYVHDGDYVIKGQPLIRLRDREFQERLKQAKASYQITLAQAKQAEAQLKETQAELKRTESLSEKGLSSLAELETKQTESVSAEANLELARARVDQALATLEERQVELSQTVIRAPVSGSVGNRNAEIGMLANPNTRLFALGQLDNLKVEVILTDRMLNYLKTGQRTEIVAEYLSSGTLTAPLARISPFLHPVTHTTIAEIDVDNPDENLKPGMFVTVDIFYAESEKATLVPLSALYDNPLTGTTGIFVCQELELKEPVSGMSGDKSITLTSPVPFKFIQVEVIAKGKMSAGVDGIDPGSWVVTLGQNLFGSESGNARVHVVKWHWVEKLQNLQSQDLLQEIMRTQQQILQDSLNGNKLSL